MDLFTDTDFIRDGRDLFSDKKGGWQVKLR